MTKRRTRKEKENARHNFLISWSPTSVEPEKPRSVNRQNKKDAFSPGLSSSVYKKANNLAQSTIEVKIKKDIIKSLFWATLILATELVIYFSWLN